MTTTPTNGFLIDANLPKRLRCWRDDACVFLPDNEWHDSLVWCYAREHKLVIVTKDGDFKRIALTAGPPVVILLWVGPASRQELWGILQQGGGPPPAMPASSPAADWCEFFPIA